MKPSAFLLPLCLVWLVATPLPAQDPTPAATPNDIPAPAATPVPPPSEKCPVCGMDKNADTCKDDKPAQPVATPAAKDETDFSQLEQTWADAIVHDDAAAIERIVADEYGSVGPDGAVMTKAEHLAAASAVAGKITEFKFSGVQTHIYGDTAVVTGTGIIHWADPAPDHLVKPGAPFRWMDVFVKRDGRWQAVASQATNIDQAASATTEN